MKNVYLIWLEWPEKCFRVDPEALRYFETLVPDGSEIIRAAGETDFLAALPRATHAIVWNFKAEWFARAPRLKVLATPGAGRELVAHDAGSVPAGVTVHFGHYHGSIMAESVAAFILAWARGFFLKSSSAWPRTDFSDRCYTVAGTKAVILGYGNIGKAIGAKLEALGVSVSGFGRGNFAALPAAAAESDWFVMALPSDTGTDNLLDADMLSHLPPRCVVINVGRGNSIDERALFDALGEKRIAGAYLDVRKREPALAADIPALDNLVLMPHSSAFAPEYVKMCFKELKDEGLI